MNGGAAVGLPGGIPVASSAVSPVELTEQELALGTLAQVDYCDAFLAVAVAGESRGGEEWARAVLEGAPLPLRTALQAGWTSLGLKLGSSPSERFVLGWKLGHSDDTHARLTAGSRLGMPAELLFLRRPEGLVLATLVRHETVVARTMWAGVAPFHRQVVPYILDITAAESWPASQK